jgi:F-type H+-transporting ATPase subunit epsilon
MGKLHLVVVTPEKVMVSKDVDIVVAPGSEGEFGILEGHISFLSGIVPGELRFTESDSTDYFSVTTGFAEVSNDKVSVLVDAAEKSGDIDLVRAKSSLERANERLAKPRDSQDVDFLRAETALKRAITRIKVAEKGTD